MVARAGVFGALTKEHREQLMPLAREVSFATDERIFNEGGKADRFWIIHTGTVALDVHVPGRRAAVIETVGAGELLGWSWLVPPHHWHLGPRLPALYAPTSSTRLRSVSCAGTTRSWITRC